jgi:pantoate kinase
MRARAPGSVTAIFVPVEDGAHGVSFTTEDGVVADVRPADETTVTLDGAPTSFEPVELACEALGVSARVGLTAEVPVGRGFGASGAATLATALAANAEFGLGLDREELVEVAASAEIEAGTGLGDVYVQDRGGLLWNVGDGRRRLETSVPLEYESYGDVATESVLGNEAAMARISEAGAEAFESFEPGGGLSHLFDLAWTFAGATGLVTDRVTETVERVQATGGTATMAMVGETVVATGVDGILENDTRITPEGARLLEG